MPDSISKIRLSAIVAARLALLIAAGSVALAGLRIVIDGLIDHRWHADWLFVLELALVLGLGSFCLLFFSMWIQLRANDPVDRILMRELPADIASSPPLYGFVAMEYYLLISNRTFVVFVAPEGLYGWKVQGPVTASQPKYFEPYVDMLSDPELMQDRDGIRQLANLKGGFFIARPEIVSAEVIYKRKWGMGPIAHSGRIKIGLVSGQSREFILLGGVNPESVRRHILGLGESTSRTHQNFVQHGLGKRAAPETAGQCRLCGKVEAVPSPA